MYLQTFLIFLLLNLVINDDSREKHLVDDLFDGLYKKPIYSGFLKTDVKGIELFYIFTPSQSSPENDPIILWLNGGPGCSSLTGFLGEIGPVKFEPYKKQPVLNEYSWNKNANVFYIESPGGVGFSTLDDPKFHFNDEIQAKSLNIAVQNFFKIYPEYQDHLFFIAGQSYSGTYIPYLVREIFKYMDNNPSSIKLRLKGFLIGNPYTFEDVDYEDSIMEFGFTHALINYDTYENYLKECPHWPQIENIYHDYNESDNYTYNPKYVENSNYPTKLVTKACNRVRNEAGNAFEGINVYGIYKECPSEEQILELKKGFKNIDYEEANLNSRMNHFKKMKTKLKNDKYGKYMSKNIRFKDANGSENDTEYEEAIDYLPDCGNNNYIEDFLNNKTIKEKLGINNEIKHSQCSDLNYTYGDSINFFKNDIKELSIKHNFSSWLYSGTEDIAVSTLATLRFLNELHYPIKEKWKNWIVDSQVAGMEQSYDYNLTFLTIKGAGHLVPEDNPKVAKVLLDKFIENNMVNSTKQLYSYPYKSKNKGLPNYGIALVLTFGIILLIAVTIITIRYRFMQPNGMKEGEIKKLV